MINADLIEGADRITSKIYKLYGSDTGYLFGIEPEHKAAVKSIVQLVLEMEKDKDNE